ncbi:lectin-like domain-containing protein [Companilactobacillus insicii]|uniref:lectin-like domain-containing protein n=1 Tax=Companilactobacillus insicii TaxID=1732567 RepID=UPI000F79071A|nr:hypothetical protein [Companilactobacillus insicii]
MNKQLRRNYGLLIVASLFLLFFTEGQTTTFAATPSISDVLKAAPSGMNLENYFEAPKTYFGDTSNTINSMVTIKQGVMGNKTDVVQMTNGSNQLASIWGRMATADAPDTPYNYFDVTKEQTFSTWMYFGDDYSKSGDGIAFVIQNDPDGINAISKTYDSLGKKNPKSGQTIGVWGGMGSPTVDRLAASAIQNSFALEFDTHHNETEGFFSQGDFFDGQKSEDGKSFLAKGQHIAWNYPGDSGVYHQKMGIINFSYYMTHNNVIQNLVMSGNDDIKEVWHHFLFKYIPPVEGSTKAHISYIFNDKNYDGSIRKYNEWDQRKNVEIDISKFNLKPGQERLRWGFTSATGSPGTKSTNNAIVFESIPAVANITASSSLYDFTQEREILDYDQNSQADVNVNNGDKLEFDYSLNYNSGLAETGAIDTKIVLPTYVDFKPDDKGVIGQAIYSNKIVNITSDEVSEGTNDKGEKISFVTLKLDSLGSKNSNIHIKLFGTANIGSDVSSTVTNVKQEHASFKSPHYSGDLMSPEFTINPVEDKLKITREASFKTVVQHSQCFELDGSIEYEKGSAFDSDKIKLYAIVDGVEQPFSDFKVTKGATKATYNIVKKASLLGLGDHTIELYVSDSKHRVSNHVTYDLSVTRDSSVLRLNSYPDYRFQDINQSPETRIVKRSGYWNLKVESLNSIWSLKAKATHLIDGNKELAGGLIFRSGDVEKSLEDNQVLVDKDDTLSDEDRIFDISSGWKPDSGILLKILPNASGGNYHGTITWTLTNSVDS